LMAARLPPVPAGHVYQVWLGRQGARMPAGRLVVDEQGDGECNLQLDGSVHSYDSAWITLEPAEGGPMPNSPGVAKGFL
ncbi:MAG: anti-sigma factor, partial [Chloroflexota bacterium]